MRYVEVYLGVLFSVFITAVVAVIAVGACLLIKEMLTDDERDGINHDGRYDKGCQPKPPPPKPSFNPHK